MFRNKVKAIVGIILVSSMLFGCGQEAVEETQTTEVLVEVQKAEMGSLSINSGFVGTIEASESVNIIPMAAGKVTDTFFEVGDMVEAGDILFKIDDEAAKLQKEQAELTLKSTKQSAAMNQNTNAINFYSQVYNAQAAIDTAEVGYKAVQRNLDDAEDALDDIDDMVDKTKSTIAAYNQYMSDYKTAVAGGDTDARDKAAASIVFIGTSLGMDTRAGDSVSLEAVGPALAKSLGDLQSAKSQAKNGVASLKDTKYTTGISLGQARQALQTICEIQAATGGQVLADSLQTGIDLAAIGVESAELALSFYEVTTPISGKIISKNVTTNGMASQQSVAYVVAQDDSMSTTFNVSEDVKNTLYIGKELVVERNGKEFKGVVSEVANSVDPMTGLFTVKADVEADGEMLPNGVNVKINCETYKEDNVVVIPYDAVYYDSEGSYVYLNKAGKAVKTFVTCGIFDEENISITEGINPGDEVVVSWASNLADGCDLKISDGSKDEVTDAN
ncbi:MAG: efflux RND transporter periplasmic adaptor subunit [Lachnospiraceae bacterium]|nr:efflux RND transporter periplasmic adaptor subunit [Lachnospiraceae bacterium]